METIAHFSFISLSSAWRSPGGPFGGAESSQPSPPFREARAVRAATSRCMQPPPHDRARSPGFCVGIAPIALAAQGRSYLAGCMQRSPQSAREGRRGGRPCFPCRPGSGRRGSALANAPRMAMSAFHFRSRTAKTSDTRFAHSQRGDVR